MRRRRTRRLVVVPVLAALVLALGGCTLSDVPVVVAGRDDDGTLVVGATDCSVGGGQPDEIRVLHTSELVGRTEIWAVEDAGSFSSAPVPAPGGPAVPAPPPPNPPALDDVDLVAVGDPDPVQWDVTRELSEPVPTTGRIEVEVDQDAFDAVPTTLTVPSGRTDSYAALVGDERIADVGRAELLTAIEDTCDEATAFDGGLFAGIVGGSSLAVVGGLVALAFLTRGQFRRAGEASRARREGRPPPGTTPAV